MKELLIFYKETNYTKIFFGRSERNRTSTKGFGDPWSTVNLRTFVSSDYIFVDFSLQIEIIGKEVILVCQFLCGRFSFGSIYNIFLTPVFPRCLIYSAGSCNSCFYTPCKTYQESFCVHLF